MLGLVGMLGCGFDSSGLGPSGSDSAGGTGSVSAGTGGDPLDTGNSLPMSFADTSPDFDEPLDGLLDAVRIWRVARSAAQICQASGDPSC